MLSRLLAWLVSLLGGVLNLGELIRLLLGNLTTWTGGGDSLRLPKELPKWDLPGSPPSPQPSPPKMPEAPQKPARAPDIGGTQIMVAISGATPVDVFFATDREPEAEGFGGDPHPKRKLTLGSATVSIPAGHRRGNLERPFSLFGHEFRDEDVREHVAVVRSPEELAEAAFYAAVKRAVLNSPREDTFVFVHGFKVSFRDGLLRTAQMAYDLGWRGAPILYSWPSKDKYFGYTSDEQIVDFSAPHLANFLESLKREVNPARLHLIAHSMGSRVLTKALDRIHLKQGQPVAPFCQEVIIAAADLNVHVFGEVAEALQSTSKHVTIYSSSRDLALRFSSFLHRETGRVGSVDSLVVAGSSIELIDAGKVDTDFLGHSYFVEETTLLDDMREVLIQGSIASDRRGRLRPAGTIWEFF